jgi:hypothetical protein
VPGQPEASRLLEVFFPTSLEAKGLRPNLHANRATLL